MAAYRSVVTEQQELRLEVDDLLHRIGERERAAHAVAPHGHEIREVAEQRGEEIPDERDAIVKPITAIVADLDDKTRQRTYEANLRRAVREKFVLPRLTLFR